MLAEARPRTTSDHLPGRDRDRHVVGGWAVLVCTAVAVGATLDRETIVLRAAPFTGTWVLRPATGILATAVAGAAVVAWGPNVARRLHWPALRLATAAAAAALVVVVNAAHGWASLTAPLVNRHEYEPFASTVGSPRRFVAGFVEAIPDLPIHVRAHPPLATLAPWSLDQVGLGGVGWWAAAVIAGWAVAVAAALTALRAVGGDAAARRAAPGMVLLPAVLWAGSSADALFAGVAATGIALVVCRPGGRAGELAGGVVLGCALLLSYGLLLVWAVPAAVAWQRRRIDGLVVAGLGTAAVLALAAAAGFWWLDGLDATRAEYWSGIAGERPLGYLAFLGNPAVLAVAVGPAVAVGFRRHAGPLSVGALGAVVVADASLMSAGEVERIWLPFVPWLALAGSDDRRWLAAQAALLVALSLVLRTRW